MLAVIVGLIGGTLSGLTGLGGGFIMVPLLVYFFGMSQHGAQGTSLAVLLPPLGLLAFMQYYRNGHVDVHVAVLVAVGFSPLVVNTRLSIERYAIPMAEILAPPVLEELSQPRPTRPLLAHGQAPKLPSPKQKSEVSHPCH